MWYNSSVMSNKKKFLIKGLEVGGDGDTDIDVGVCDSKRSAERLCAKLEAENKAELRQYNDFCSRCECNCESFSTQKEADEKCAAIKAAMSGCPHVGKIKAKELFINDGKSKKDKSIGFEVCCKSYRYPTEYTYYAEEIDSLEDAE